MPFSQMSAIMLCEKIFGGVYLFQQETPQKGYILLPKCTHSGKTIPGRKPAQFIRKECEELMKKIWKRSLSLFLAFVMVFGMLPVSAFADETEPVITEEPSVVEPAAAEAPENSAEETTVPATEAPVVETTVPVTEAPVVETTVPVTEAPEAEPAVPETTVPETTVAGSASKDAANSVAEAPSEPEETEPEIPGAIHVSDITGPRNLPTSEELFAGYASHLWFGTELATFGTDGRSQLDDDTRAVYDALVPVIKEIAAGTRSSAHITVASVEGADLDTDAEANFAPSSLQLSPLLDALLADMPYEMYWFEKTVGVYGEYRIVGSVYVLELYFCVAPQYNNGEFKTVTFQDDDGESYDVTYYYAANTSKTGAVTGTEAAALAVVSEVAGRDNVKTDYDKLLAYKDWICANTAYNKDVESGELTFSENIDPWQVIYVFDNDSTTDVVCEGYSKAFQYLCELTFSKEDPAEETVTCYSVTGTLVGEGDHMWNIVEIEGEHYLADITNSDEGTVGSDGSLFLVGGTPDSTGVYTFATKGTSTAGFAYDSDTKSLWGDSGILTLAESNYEPPVEEEPEEPDVTEPAEGMTQDEFAAELAANAGTNYVLSQSVTIKEDMTIRMATEEVPYDHSVLVNTGATLTVASGATLTMETDFMVGGGTVIVEDGGKLVIGTSNTRGMLYVWGGTLDVAAESGLDLTYGRITVQYGSDYEIPDWISESSINAQAYIRESAQLQEMLALTQYAFIDIYVQCDLTVSEDITIAGNQFLGVQYPYSMTVEDGVTVTVATGGVLFCSDGAVINNNGQILCYGQFQDYGTLNGNAVELVKEEWDDAAFLEAMENAENNFLWLSSNVTISGNVEIPSEVVVYVSDNATVTVAEDATLTVNGQLSANGGTILVNGTLIKNGWMHTDNMHNSDSSSNLITISETGEFQNNSGMFLGSGTLTIDGTYTPGENGYVAYDDTKAVINGIEKIGDQLQIQIIARSEEELISALEKRDGIEIQTVYADEDITLDSDLTVPGGVSLTICYSYGNDSDYKTLTIPEGVTLTVEGSLGVAEHGEIILEAGATIVNNGWIGLDGRLVKNGTVEGNDIEIFGGTVVAPDMTQSEFAAAVAEAERNGEVYFLERNVTLTGNMTLTSEVRVRSGASLTVDGCTLNILDNGNGDDYIYGHLIAEGGTITVKSNAALNIHAGLLQVWKGGFLTLEEGADLTGVQADEIWVHMTDLTEIPVSGLTANMLGAVFNPRNAAEIEDAFAQTNTYAHISVVPFIDNVIVLDRNIVIPAGDDLSLRHDITLKIPAGFTLTNNGIINLEVAGNRLEVLMDGTLVNNGTINVDEYAQFVVRGNLFKDGDESDIGTVNGSIIWGEMSHEDLMAAMAQCAATESNWIHESITTLDPNFNEGFLRTSDLGIRSDGEIANELHLLEYGTIIVPAGCTLEVTNPLIVHEGGKVIVEEGGKLIVNGLLSVEGGTVYIAGDFEEGENSCIEGRLTFEGDTAPWLSETWLDNQDEGWYWPEENILHESHGLHVMDCHWRIYFLNTWDAENMVWNAVPVIPTEVSEYMTITLIMDMEDQFIRGDQEYAEYYVCVDVFGTLEHQDVNLFVNGNPYPYELFQRTVAFYSEPTVSMDTLINDGHHSMNGETEEEAVYWLVKEPEYFDVLNFSWNLETWGEDYTQYTGGDPLVVLDDSQAEQGIYKFVIDPDYVEYTKFNWKNFNLQIHMELDDNRDGENNINIEYWDRDIWIDPAPQAEPKAHLRINNQTYLVFENDIVYRDYFTGEYDEQGYEIWDREKCSLPAGVSYVPEDNKLILDNAHLERLELAYMDCWEDDNGYHEEQRLPSENLSLVVYGESSIMNGSECAMIIRNGTNVNISGTGNLHLYAENSPDNINEEGNRYAYPTVRINDGSSLNLSGGVTVTAEIDGSGYHGDMPAQMSAIDGYSEDPAYGNTLTINDNAVLTIVTPEGTRTLDESQENYGGARGIVSVNIEVNDNATLNTGSIYLWDTVDFTMNGGTVNLDPIGEVFYNYRLEDLLLSNLGIYLEHEDSVFTMNGGTINMDLNPNEENDGYFNYNTFQGINAALGHVYINGGEININGENAMGGNGIAIQCGWTEDGPDFSAPASSLTITGGTVNISGVEGEFEGIYVAPAASAELSGGAVYAYGGENYFEGHVDWTGNTELTGNIYVLDGSDVIVKNGARLTINDTANVMTGGRIIVEDGGTLYVRGTLDIEGTVYMRSGASLSTDPGHQINGKITWEGDTAPYLTATWLDNYDNEGWYMNDEFFEENGLMSMEEHWRIFFLNTWDATNLVWNSEPVVPTESNDFMTITRVVGMEDQHIREDQDPAYSEYFVRVEVYGTLDRQDVTLSANGYSIPFEIHERHTGFFRTTEFTLDSIIQGHDFVLDPTAEDNSIYWLVRDTENYDIIYEEFNYRTWNDEDYSDYITGEDLIVLDDSRKDEGIYKITVDPGFVDYVQYDFKNFEIQVNMTLDYNGDEEIYEEYNNGGMWIQPPELKDPAAALNIDHAEYMIYDTGRIFRDYFTGEYDEWGNEIWNRQETALPDGVSYVLSDNKLILDGVDLTVLNLKPSASGYDENGNFWEVFGLPKENLTISLVGDSIIENHCGPAVMIEHGMNVTVTGNGSLYAKTTNYPDYRDENGELQCFNTINVYGGSTLTIGDNATVTAELSGHGYWGNGEAATCHAISGSYEGDALVITDNATVTTVLPNGVRRYDNTGKTSQIGGYVGIQNFNTVTVSGGTLNTDHLNFYNGGEFNLTGGTANFRDIGGINSFTDKEGNDVTECHYEGINMRGGSVNISGGTLNIDVTASESDNCTFSGFYGINVVNGTMDVTGGEINITANTDGWAILADCEWTEEGWVEGTGSTFGITGGTIHVNNADRTYHGGILISEICSGYFGGGEINDDYGIHRFCGDTVWGDSENGDGTVLNGTAANVYTHGPGNFYMYGGLINLTGDIFEADGETVINNAIFEANGPETKTSDETFPATTLFGGEIRLTNGTFRNQSKTVINGGKITVNNDCAGLIGLQNRPDDDYPAADQRLLIGNGTIDITTNGIAIENNGPFYQAGGSITAVNTESSMPVMVSNDQTTLASGTLNLRGGNIGLVQSYNFDLAKDEIDGNESMLFVASVENLPAPYLSIADTKVGLYLNAPAFITGGANVDIQVAGEAISENRKWPMAIYVEKHTGNPDLTGDNVSLLLIDGGANVRLISRDTTDAEAMSKGIVAWYSPLVIGAENAVNVTIDAEMALYSMTATNDVETDANIPVIMNEIRSLSTGEVLMVEGEAFQDGYLYTAKEADNSYAGNISISQNSGVSSLAELKNRMTYHEDMGRWALEEAVYIEGSFALDQIIVDVVNGGTLYVAEGVTLTVNEGSHLIAQERGTILVDGTIENYGIMAADCGSITFRNAEGYTCGEGVLMNVHYRNGVMSAVSGVTCDMQQLFADCATVDQIHYILGLEHRDEYARIEIHVNSDMTLNTMTIPENTELYINGGTVTVEESAIVVNNGGITTNRVGTLLKVDGILNSNRAIFINDGSVMEVNGTLNNRDALHVGFWRDPNTDAIAGTLNINGTLNNYAYLNICPDFYIEADDRYCGGIVNVNEGGKLDNTFDDTAKKSGFVDLGGRLNVYGTMMNGQLVEICGSLHLYGKLDNGGTIRLYDLIQPELVTHEGAELINNTMIGNFSREGIISLAEGTYTQGSHNSPDGTTPGELDARFFDNQYMALIEGAPKGTVSIFYEGDDAEALLAASEAYNWGEGKYDRCFLRVVGDMIFPEDLELNLAPGSYLVVLNNGDNYQGSLTVEGGIFNQGYIRLFGADMIIAAGGSVRNENMFETGTMVYTKATETEDGTVFEEITLKPTVTISGDLHNTYTGTLDLSNATVETTEGFTLLNELTGDQLGVIKGVNTSDQILWSDIADGGQARLQELINMVQTGGYRSGSIWISKDLHITESMVIPANVCLTVLAGGTLTVDSNVTVQNDGWMVVDAGGNLNVNGALGIGGTADIYGTATVAGPGTIGLLSAEAWFNVTPGGKVVNNGYFSVNSGFLNVIGTFTNNGTAVVTYQEGTVSGTVSNLILYMPVHSNENVEAEIETLKTYAKKNGFTKTQVHFFCDHTFENGYTIPANMSVIIGAYRSETDYTAATITIPAGKTLTIDGEVQVSQKSALVIEDTAELICNGSFVTFGSCSDEISWFLVNGVLTIEGTGDMLDYAENSAPWAEYNSLIKSVEFGEGITGITPEKTVIAELDTNVQANKPVTVTTESTISDITDSSIVGAALNAADDSNEVKLVIGNASGDNTISSGYTGTLFSMTLEGVENASELAVPVKITLNVPATIKNPESLVVLHYENGAQEVLERTVFQKDNAWYVSFIVDGFSDFAIVEEAEEEPVALYDFGQTSQIWLIEPWALRANLRVYHLKDDGTRGTQLTGDEMAALNDYGVYFIRESDLGIENATQNNVTKDDIMSNEHVIHMTKTSGDVTHNTGSNMLSCDFDEGIYTYELSDSVFVLYYVVKDGRTYYAPIRERNLSEMVNKYKDDATSYPDEKERAVFATMAQLESDTLTYRNQWENPGVLEIMDAPTLQTNPLGAPSTHSVKFGHTMNIILIEPWGLQFNGMVTSDVTYDDYGVVVYYDTDGTAAGITEAADLLALDSAYVFSVKNGDATVAEQSDGREKITAVYNADLYTYQMTKIAYVMFYVQDGDNFYYGPIKERTIQAAINSRLGVAGVNDSLEGNVLNSMLNLYDAIKAYREGFGIYD